MEEFNHKERFLKLAEIVEKIKAQNNTQSFLISSEEKEFIKQIRDQYADQPEYLELLDKIVKAPRGEAAQVVNEFFKEEKEKEKKEEAPEEEISKAFGVRADQIKHLYLKNGKEIFFFYSAALGRDVILENNKIGHSISEVLQEIQDSDEKYQSDDPEKNTNDIMMDARLKTNLEFDMYPPEEVPQHTSEIESLNENEKALLNYLLGHVEEFHIKTINIEHLIYLNDYHEVKQIRYDKDFKPVIESPTGEENTPETDSMNETPVDDNNPIEESNSNEISGEENHQELDDMFENEEEKDDELKNELQESKDAKKLVLTKPNEQGYAAYIGLIVALIAVIALTILALQVLSML